MMYYGPVPIAPYASGFASPYAQGFAAPYARASLSDLTPLGVLVPPIGAEEILRRRGPGLLGAFGAEATNPSPPPPKPPGFDWASLAAKAAIVAVGVGAFFIIRHAMHVATQTQEEVSEAAGGALRDYVSLRGLRE